MNLLKKAVTDLVDISPEELDEFCSYFKLKKIKRNEYILNQGEICVFEAFINKGSFQMLFTSENGKLHTLCFAEVGMWIADLDSYINKIPSQFSIQAIEDSELLIISRSDQEKCYSKMHSVDKLFRILSERSIINFRNKYVDSISKSAQERYVEFIGNSSVANRLTNIQVASHIGVSREFVSKIRRKITSG